MLYTQSSCLLPQPSLPPRRGAASTVPSHCRSSPPFFWASALSNSHPHCCGQPKPTVGRGTCQPPGNKPICWLLPLVHYFFPLCGLAGSLEQLLSLIGSTWGSGDFRVCDSSCSEVLWSEEMAGFLGWVAVPSPLQLAADLRQLCPYPLSRVLELGKELSPGAVCYACCRDEKHCIKEVSTNS